MRMVGAGHDYVSTVAAAAASLLTRLEWRRLLRFLTQIVESEFNVAYFVFDQGVSRTPSLITK